MAAAELALAPRRQRCDRARIAGVDEAGRGPLAGPVVAAAVILDPRRRVRGLADSKLLTAQQRERLALLIRARALAFGIGWADRDEIDCLNILERSEEHTSELQSLRHLVCRLLLEKKNEYRRLNADVAPAGP